MATRSTLGLRATRNYSLNLFYIPCRVFQVEYSMMNTPWRWCLLNAPLLLNDLVRARQLTARDHSITEGRNP
jgi:hypothetical protein